MIDAKCPHCEEVNTDLWELFTGSDETSETKCSSCGKDIIVIQHKSIWYEIEKDVREVNERGTGK